MTNRFDSADGQLARTRHTTTLSARSRSGTVLVLPCVLPLEPPVAVSELPWRRSGTDPSTRAGVDVPEPRGVSVQIADVLSLRAGVSPGAGSETRGVRCMVVELLLRMGRDSCGVREGSLEPSRKPAHAALPLRTVCGASGENAGAVAELPVQEASAHVEATEPRGVRCTLVELLLFRSGCASGMCLSLPPWFSHIKSEGPSRAGRDGAVTEPNDSRIGGDGAVKEPSDSRTGREGAVTEPSDSRMGRDGALTEPYDSLPRGVDAGTALCGPNIPGVREPAESCLTPEPSPAPLPLRRPPATLKVLLAPKHVGLVTLFALVITLGRGVIIRTGTLPDRTPPPGLAAEANDDIAHLSGTTDT